MQVVTRLDNLRNNLYKQPNLQSANNAENYPEHHVTSSDYIFLAKPFQKIKEKSH